LSDREKALLLFFFVIWSNALSICLRADVVKTSKETRKFTA